MFSATANAGFSALEAPEGGGGSAVRKALGQVYERVEAAEISRDEAASGVLDVVETFDLRRVDTLPPVEKITAEALGVVCWMAVLGLDRRP